MIILGSFCVYRQLYKSSKETYNYGKLSSAFMENYGELHSVDILAFHSTMSGAREDYRANYEKKDGYLRSDGAIYRTIQEAAADTGVSVGTIRHHMAGRQGYEAPRGFTFIIYPKILL